LAETGTKYERDMEHADYPLIRFYQVPDETASVPMDDTSKKAWTVVNPQSVRDISAVGYYFAQKLYLDKKVPVGVISASKGASKIEAWISADGLKSNAEYKCWLNSFDNNINHWNTYVQQCKENERKRAEIILSSHVGTDDKVYENDYDDRTWNNTVSPIDTKNMSLSDFWGVAWLRHPFDINNPINSSLRLEGDFVCQAIRLWINGNEILKNAEGKYVISSSILKTHNMLAVRLGVHWGTARLETEEKPLRLISETDGKQVFVLNGAWKYNEKIEPKAPGHQNYYNTNTVLYNARIAPIQPFSLRGILWYQGESNVAQVEQYKKLLPQLIEDWRHGFNQGALPFLIVQLPNYMRKSESLLPSDWAYFREAQALAAKNQKVGLAVTIDLGEANDIHPKDKVDVAQRLFLQAKRLAYNQSVIASGPIFKSMRIDKDTIFITFDQASRLIVKGHVLAGFAISGANRLFSRAKATIMPNHEVAVYSDAVKSPTAVRYAWENNPDANLYNQSGLPAAPFRTDNWPLDKTIPCKVFSLFQQKTNGVYQKDEPIQMKFYTDDKNIDSVEVKVITNFQQIQFSKLKYNGDTLLVYNHGFNTPTSVMVEVRTEKDFVNQGAIVEPTKFTPGLDRPSDILSYWKKQKSKMRKLPWKITKNKVSIENSDFDVYDVSLNCLAGKSATGYLVQPKNARPHSLPIILAFHSAGVKGFWCRSDIAKAENLAKIEKGALCFDLNAHGMLNGQPDSYYNDLEDHELKNYQYQGVENRDSCYFKGMYLRLLRAIDYMTTLPEWDGKRILVLGESQGGGQALVAAGLDHRVTAVVATVPAMCDWGGTIVGRKGGWPNPFGGSFDKDKLKKSIPYYDAANIIKDSPATFVVEIGLVDTTCPSSSVFAAMNGVKGKTTILTVPYRPHQTQNIAQKSDLAHWKSTIDVIKNKFIHDFLK
jgi:sialate O-acetylesterase